jgi:hypothetical protein
VKVALRLLLLLGFAALGLFVFREVPRNVGLVYAIDDPSAVRRVDVEIRKADAAVRHAEFRFPAGAPAQFRHDVKLADGEYRVEVQVWRVAGAPGRAAVPLAVAESGPVVLAIHDRPIRSD